MIELEGTGQVSMGPGLMSWFSGEIITYNIPDGLLMGVYVYTINFTDTSGNSVIDSFTFTVSDTVDPIVTHTPEDITVESGYSWQNILWRATDLHPGTYTIELEGTGVVAGPTYWMSGQDIYYDIPDGHEPGDYIYTITFLDSPGNSVSDSITFTVETTDTGLGDAGVAIIVIAAISVVAVVAVVIMKKR
jgi:hypothetical protein